MILSFRLLAQAWLRTVDIYNHFRGVKEMV